MKNLRKILTTLVDEHLAKSPDPKGVAFSKEEMRAAALELVDGVEALATVASSLERIALALESLDRREGMRDLRG